MPTKKLTDLFVERVKPPARGRAEYFDAAFPGLALRVTENGAKSWSVFYRLSDRLRRFTLGGYPAIKPAQARREASAALERVRLGFDPAEERRARRDVPSPESETFGAVAQDYLDRYLSKNTAPATFAEAKRDLEKNILPKWRNRPIASITRRDAIDLIDGIIARGAEIQGNRSLARLRAMFNWAIEKDRVAVSPVDRMKPPTKEHSRDRVLSDDELRWFMLACDAIGWPFGPLAKLLLLTAQRRDEVGGITWSELDLDRALWTQPKQRAKNNRAHEVQLSEAAVDVLRALPHVASGLVFTTNGRPVSGFSHGKRRLDAAMFKAKCDELGDGAEPIPHWILHDLRRTAATGMARLKIPPHVVDKILNHTSGTIRGVAAVYNRFAYIDERHEALEAWARYVTALMQPAASNVLVLRG